LRQDPGPQNPLGKIKFLFTNNFRVYLHDTPAQQLFDQTERSFSHGCIRVSDPSRLAAYLLVKEPQGQWNKETIRSAMNSKNTSEVAVAPSVPIYLLYLTAWVGDDGAVHFRRDIYGEDEILLIDLPDGEL
jgi:murein L,D-transpeptidase YcbB/YkuD